MTESDPSTWTHGKASTYNTFKCRCPECTKANTERMSDLRVKRRAAKVPDGVHGTENGYVNYGCKCAECKAAGSAKNARYYKGRNKKS